jgi:hypothetical protein
MNEPKNLMEALVDIARLKQENNALRFENNGLHEWAERDRKTIAGYRKECAELRAELMAYKYDESAQSPA